MGCGPEKQCIEGPTENTIENKEPPASTTIAFNSILKIRTRERCSEMNPYFLTRCYSATYKPVSSTLTPPPSPCDPDPLPHAGVAFIPLSPDPSLLQIRYNKTGSTTYKTGKTVFPAKENNY